MVLVKGLLGLRLDCGRDPLRRPAVLQHGGHRCGHFGLLAVTRSWRMEFLLQGRQLLQGPFDPPAAGHGVLLGLPQTVIPDQPITLDRGSRLVAGRVAVKHLAFLVGLFPQPSPGDLALGQPLAKGGVFAAGPRQDGDEAALALVEIGHVFAGGQFAVGHVEKVAAAGQLAQQVPGVAVGLVVGHVAAFGAEVQRHAAVGGDREDEQELLQIGTMVLVVAEGDRQRGTAQVTLRGRGLGVGAAESDRGGIVVQFVQGDAELLDDVRRHGQDQRGHVGHKQPVQRASHAIVVQPREILGQKAQRLGSMAGRPFAHAIDRLAGKEQIAEQDQQRLDRRELGAAIFRRQCRAEEILQPHAPQKVVEDRQRADGGGAQHLAAGTGLRWRRRFGERRPRLVRWGMLGGHVLGLLAGTVPAACGLRALVTLCGRNRAESCHRSQEGNVQQGRESSTRAACSKTYGAGHRRKSSPTRLTSMARFVSIFRVLRRRRRDIAAGHLRRDDSFWTRVSVLTPDDRLRRRTPPSRFVRKPASPGGNSKISQPSYAENGL